MANRQTLDEWLREQGQLPGRPSRQINIWEDMDELGQALPPPMIPMGSTSVPNPRQSDVLPVPLVPSRPAPLVPQQATQNQGGAVPKQRRTRLVPFMQAESIEPLRQAPPLPPLIALPPSQTAIEEPDEQPVDSGQVHGPPNWPDVYRDFESVGFDYRIPWSRPEHRELYEEILAEDGFILKDWNNDRIYQGTDNLFDHSVWKVYRMEGTGQASEEVTYACKVVGLQYYQTKRPTFKITLNVMLKEAQLLLGLDHINVVKVIANIPFRDQQTSFPFSFMAIVMEFMDGSLRGLIKDQTNERMEENMCRSWFIDMARGLEYLHYNIRGPGDKALVVAHMAFSPKNILYKVIDANTSKYIFKLSDFEESMIYETDDPDSFHKDYVQSYSRQPYTHSFCAPELKLKNWSTLYLRARPTDIFSLAFCLAYAIEGGLKPAKELLIQLRKWSNVKFEGTYCHLIKLMTTNNPNDRPDIRQVLQHQWVTEVENEEGQDGVLIDI